MQPEVRSLKNLAPSMLWAKMEGSLFCFGFSCEKYTLVECINHPPGGELSTKLCFTQFHDISDAP